MLEKSKKEPKKIPENLRSKIMRKRHLSTQQVECRLQTDDVCVTKADGRGRSKPEGVEDLKAGQKEGQYQLFYYYYFFQF